MTRPSSLIVPRAIYFDANALVAAPQSLATQAIAEITEIARILGSALIVPELAAEEWIAHRCDNAAKAIRQIEANAKQIGTMLNREALHWERISHEDLQAGVREALLARLEQSRIQIVPTPQIELASIVNRFLQKRPPFNAGDRGFKDAIIIETIIQHACRDNHLDHVVVVSSDSVFEHPTIVAQFSDAGTVAHIVGGKPEALFGNLVNKLQSMWTEAVDAVLAHKREAALNFAKLHEAEILRCVAGRARMGRSDLMGYGLKQFGREADEADRKLEFSRMVSIDAIRPAFVESAFLLGRPGDRSDGRTTLVITVAIEIDLTIASRNPFAETRVPIANAAHLLEPSIAWDLPETLEPLTVKRNVTVNASVASEGVESDEYRDLRLEGD